MLKLEQLLSRFKNLHNTEKIKKELIIDVFKKNNIPININQISFSKTLIIINVQPIIKTELLFKKEFFLDKIKNLPNLSYISDIK